MKKLILLALAATLGGVGCKDKKKDPAPAQPEPVKYGTVRIKVISYDSLGNPESGSAGVNVQLVEDKLSATTDAAGEVVFTNLPYGTHTPVLTKTGYEGPLMTVYLNAPEYTANLPLAKHSHYRALNFNGRSIDENNVYVSFNLSPAVPPDSLVKVIVLGHITNDLSQRKFTSADLLFINRTVVTDENIAILPEFKTMLAQVDSSASFYVTVIPVSYGFYKSNLQEGPQVLGESLHNAGNVSLVKTW